MYKCPSCDYTSGQAGNCPTCNVPMNEITPETTNVEQQPVESAPETPAAPEAPIS